MLKLLSRPNRWLLLIGLVALAVLFSPGHSAQALTISPPSLEFNLEPGQSVTQTIKVINDGLTPVTIYSSTANFFAQGEGDEPAFDLGAAPTDLATWITIPTEPITITGQDRQDVSITISIPATAEPGGHYASVFFGDKPRTPTGGGQVGISSLLGTLVIVRVAGDVREAAAVAQLGLDGGKSTLTRLPATLFARIQNTGNVHVRPEGTIQIKNMFGQNSANLTVNDLSGAVLPNSIRRFDAIWGNASASAKKGFFSEIAAEWKNFRVGTYTATANLTYGQSKQALTGTVKFTIFPWRLLLVEFLVLAGLIILIVFGLKRYNAAIINRAEKHIRPIPPTGKG